LYHPQVQVHAIVEYKNNSYAFISPPNMEISIKLALTKFRDASKYIKVLEREKYQLETIDPKKY
jgi:1-deoxy-D-xylulose 5-phosphate reductoisomerase